MNARERLRFVDGLRGLAASLVVAEHFYLRVRADVPLPAVLSWVLSHGHLGVAIFFVLSGFVIAMSVGDRKMSATFLGRFAVRRALRLDPPYWLSMLAVVALAAVAETFFQVEKTHPTAPQVVAHLFYLQDLVGVAPMSAVYWTLCLEVQFYMFFILLLWAIQTWRGCADTSSIIGRPIHQAVVIGLALLSLGELNDVWNIAPAGAFLPYWFCFTLGATAYWAVEGWVGPRSLILLGVMVLGAAVGFRNDWCAAAAGVAALLYAAARLGKMSVWLAGNTMQFLGRVSYSLYLFHATVGWSAMSVALRYLPQWSGVLTALGAALIGVAASVVSAWLAYLAVERHSVRLSHLIRVDPSPRPAHGESGERVAIRDNALGRPQRGLAPEGEEGDVEPDLASGEPPQSGDQGVKRERPWPVNRTGGYTAGTAT